MKRYEPQFDAHSTWRLDEAVDRLSRFYEATNQPRRAADISRGIHPSQDHGKSDPELLGAPKRAAVGKKDYWDPGCCGASPVRAGAGLSSCGARDCDGVIRIGPGAVRAGAWGAWGGRRAVVGAGAGTGAGAKAAGAGAACGASFCSS